MDKKILSNYYSEINRSHHGIARRDIKIRYWPSNRHEAVFWSVDKGSCVLDIGCGNGFLLWNLKNKFEKLYGLELSESMREEASKNLRDQNAIILSGSVEELPFENNYFDYIICADVIEHVPNVWQAFKEISRVLSAGGFLITTTPNVAYFKRRLRLIMGRFPVTSGYDEGLIPGGGINLFAGGHFHYFTFRSLRKNYIKFGIKPLIELGYGRLGKIHNLWRTMLSGGICIKGTKLQ